MQGEDFLYNYYRYDFEAIVIIGVIILYIILKLTIILKGTRRNLQK